MQGGIGDDGLLQRFQMLVWPAVSSKWNNIDRAPHKEGRERADWVFQQIDQLKPEGIGAEAGYGDIPALHFDGEAQELFNEWRGILERRLRGGSEDQAPAFESHLSKYRSLLPSLALIFHLTDVVAGGQSGPVSLDATQLAAAWCEYLEKHALKIYAAELNHDLAAAHAIEFLSKMLLSISASSLSRSYCGYAASILNSIRPRGMKSGPAMSAALLSRLPFM